jgi:transglutaminase-like putative cysteine protease
MKPQFEGIDAVYKSKADNKDIRDLLVKLVPKAKAQMVTFAKQFKGRTQQETCKNIFDYIKSNFTYVADGGEQIIKLPSALLRKRVGDCKSYSLFTASILENLKIPYKFVYTSYSANPIPQHVYVVTENGCIIDVVYGTFNAEKKPTYKYTQDMNVRYMSGISGNCNCDSQMGKITIISKNCILLHL